MQNQKNDGGPAFPVIAATKNLHFPSEEKAAEYRKERALELGMTLRDYFAAKAMQGFLAGRYSTIPDPEYAAEHSYKIADAMLKERAK